MKIRLFAAVAVSVLLAACSTSKPPGQMTEDGVKLAKNFGKVEVEFSTFGDWKSIKSTASANVPIEHDSGVEQAMNLATLRAKRNIVEFIQSDIKSKKTSDALVDAMIDQNVSKERATKMSQKISESIVEQSSGIIRGAYVDDRKITDDGKNVTVVVIVDKRSLESSNLLKSMFSTK